MNSITINHLGKRAFDFRINNGKIAYQWVNFIDEDGYDSVKVEGNINNIISTEKVEKGITKVFYN